MTAKDIFHDAVRKAVEKEGGITIEEYQLSLAVYDPVKEVIAKWLK